MHPHTLLAAVGEKQRLLNDPSATGINTPKCLGDLGRYVEESHDIGTHPDIISAGVDSD